MNSPLTLVLSGWKRLLLADGPRQTINALTLYAIYIVKSRQQPGNWYDVSRYFVGNSVSTSALTVTTFFTVAVFAGSLLLLLVAAICYIPLLCHIRGNLKVRVFPLTCSAPSYVILGVLLPKGRQSKKIQFRLWAVN